MNIPDKIEQLKVMYEQTLMLHPYLTEVFYTVPDVPVEALKTFAEDNKLPVEYNEWQKALRANVYCGKLYIILVSKKVKPIVPVALEYVEFDEDAHYAAAKDFAIETAQSFRH